MCAALLKWEFCDRQIKTARQEKTDRQTVDGQENIVESSFLTVDQNSFSVSTFMQRHYIDCAAAAVY